MPKHITDPNLPNQPPIPGLVKQARKRAKNERRKVTRKQEAKRRRAKKYDDSRVDSDDGRDRYEEVGNDNSEDEKGDAAPDPPAAKLEFLSYTHPDTLSTRTWNILPPDTVLPLDDHIKEHKPEFANFRPTKIMGAADLPPPNIPFIKQHHDSHQQENPPPTESDPLPNFREPELPNFSAQNLPPPNIPVDRLQTWFH